MAILTVIFLILQEQKRNCMLFTIKWNVTTDERFAHAPTAYVMARSCGMFGKHWIDY
jgi:hypothetical protein